MSISSVLMQFVIHVIWNVICASALADFNPRRAEDPEEELSVRVYMQGLKLSEPLRYTLQDPVKHRLTNKFKLPDPVIFFSEQESELPSPPSPTYRGLSGKVHWSKITFTDPSHISSTFSISIIYNTHFSTATLQKISKHNVNVNFCLKQTHQFANNSLK